MRNNLRKSNKVSFCDKNRNCFHVYGKNADLITYVVVGILAVVGLSFAAKRISK